MSRGDITGPLTPSEREVLVLTAQGQTVAQIAKHLQRSQKTVKAHRTKVYAKLRLQGIARLTLYAVREGLVTP